MTSISLRNIVKRYGEAAVVNGVSLDVPSGSIMTLLGPSGCGKSTTLRILAGFVQPDAGEIRIGGRVVNDIPPERRPTAMVFQNYALWPHKTVEENIAFGLRVRRLPREDIKKRTADCLKLVGLDGLAKRYPRQLSGGQRQRVALARGLAIEPGVLLLDEPLSNLDAKLRVRMRTELLEIQKKIGTTMIFVTHDQEEALSISDWVAIMKSGQIEQVDTPVGIYRDPATLFVASFLGQTNFLAATVMQQHGDELRVQVQGGELLARSKGTFKPGQGVVLGIRSEDVPLAEGDETNTIQGRIKVAEFLGGTTRWHVEIGGRNLSLDRPGFQMPQDAGREIRLHLPPTKTMAFAPDADDILD